MRAMLIGCSSADCICPDTKRTTPLRLRHSQSFMLEPNIDTLIVSSFPLRLPSDITWAIAPPSESIRFRVYLRSVGCGGGRSPISPENIFDKYFNIVPRFP